MLVRPAPLVHMAWVGWLVFATGCSGVTASPSAEPDPPACDGVLQDGEGRIDGPFDRDGDGSFDRNDPGCANTYSVFALDCDDGDFQRHPEASELACNDVDDDCNADTPDALDGDGDGTIACDDCDDLDPSRHPAASDTCWDAIDNDCDGRIDPDCGPNYNGSFTLDRTLRYSCATSLVNIEFSEVGVIWNPPNGAMFPLTGSQPGPLNGVVEPNGTFLFEGSTVVSSGAGCDEYYRFSGVFLDEDHLEMTFEAVFIGATCFNCNDQTITDLTATRTF